MLTLKTIDAHAGGEPLRLVVDGFPAPRGQTMIDKREWAKRHADHLRRALMLEPRGHADMCGAVLTEPVSPGSHAGVLFMDNDGYGDLSGHGIIAATTIALERGLLMPGGDGGDDRVRHDRRRDPGAGGLRGRRRIGRDSPVGRDREPDVRVERVSVTNAPSFVLHGGLAVAFGWTEDSRRRRVRRRVPRDCRRGSGRRADRCRAPRRAAPRRTRDQPRRRSDWSTIAHPLEPRLRGIYGTMFTGPPHEDGTPICER